MHYSYHVQIRKSPV